MRGSYALSFAGSKPHRLQPPIFDVQGHLKVMDQGQVQMAALEANTNSLGYRLSGAHGEAWSKLYNECVNDLIRKHPDRFVGMAMVPLQEPSRAAKVLERRSSHAWHGLSVHPRRLAWCGEDTRAQLFAGREGHNLGRQRAPAIETLIATCGDWWRLSVYADKKVKRSHLLSVYFRIVALTSGGA